MNAQLNVLVIDDDELIRDSLQSVIETHWNFIGLSQYSKVDAPVHAALIDMHLSTDFSRHEGLEAIKQVAADHPQAEIIAISGDLNRSLMEKTLKAGAFRFLPKPLSPDEVLLSLHKIQAYFNLVRPHLGQKWVGDSDASTKVRRQISQLKGEKTPILLEGESGTGKEVVAQLLNKQESSRPFVSVNVAALPTNLFEAELFGYSKGAFTGAQQNKMGLAESANGGDLFLDEIEALPMELQAKLLRFLESGEIRRVGSNESTVVKTRVIAATNENLHSLVKQNRFREDLLWRLSGHTILLPPLRERSDDIGALCDLFLNHQSHLTRYIDEEALTLLQQHSWPGNVRELKRLCQNLQVSAPLPVVRAEDVHPYLQPLSTSLSAIDKIDFNRGLPSLMTDFERQVLDVAIQTEKDVDALAKTLKISRSSLYKKLKDYGLSL